MEEISSAEIIERMRSENPWWSTVATIDSFYRAMKPRAYLNLFLPLIQQNEVHRAVILMGPRRVGKTVMIHHTIQHLLDEHAEPKKTAYISVDHPIYNGLSIEKMLTYISNATGTDFRNDGGYVILDEIQYLRNWEVHLKTAVDAYRKIHFIASGSATAALKLKSHESGAGRFTEFLLPPLTFYEYLSMIGRFNLVRKETTERNASRIQPEAGFKFVATDITELNREFTTYLNFGGYPEVVFSEQIKNNPSRFIKSDIIDKVLLRDIPSLYGISDVQELNSLFTTIAFNTASEISLQQLSQNAGIAKNTIKRYIEYLEAAFLVKVVHRVDHTARKFERATSFKVYLTNPSMRTALFTLIRPEDEILMGRMAETAIFSQWFHSDATLHYARWDKKGEQGEVDLIHLDPGQQSALWAVEVKWSDRYMNRLEELNSAISFCNNNQLDRLWVTSKTVSGTKTMAGLTIEFSPSSIYCFTVGYNLIHSKGQNQFI